MMETLYNSGGRAIAYIDDDGQSIYLFRGEPVAWLSVDRVYSYSGGYLGWVQEGWVQEGWVFDRSGNRAFFTSEASGGPARPARSARPARGARGARPARGARRAAPARPARRSVWSSLSGVMFFEQ